MGKLNQKVVAYVAAVASMVCMCCGVVLCVVAFPANLMAEELKGCADCLCQSSDVPNTCPGNCESGCNCHKNSMTGGIYCGKS